MRWPDRSRTFKLCIDVAADTVMRGMCPHSSEIERRIGEDAPGIPAETVFAETVFAEGRARLQKRS